LLTVAAEVFFVGFVGTQRVWFLRRARGIEIRPSEVWSLSWRFFGRFFVLDLLCAIPVAAVAIPIVAINTHQVISPTGSITTTTSNTWVLTVAIVALSFVGDVVFTFVVPALALSTRSVRTSFRLGWQVTKHSWPTNAWYLLAPGITLLALSGALPHSLISTGGALAVGLVSTLLGLCFKGANVAFYMRSMPPVGVDGAP
jgi:membrane-anchored glycerophosphoryl diester phosphodiesterase (GDPDase)